MSTPAFAGAVTTPLEYTPTQYPLESEVGGDVDRGHRVNSELSQLPNVTVHASVAVAETGIRTGIRT